MNKKKKMKCIYVHEAYRVMKKKIIKKKQITQTHTKNKT